MEISPLATVSRSVTTSTAARDNKNSHNLQLSTRKTYNCGLCDDKKMWKSIKNIKCNVMKFPQKKAAKIIKIMN